MIEAWRHHRLVGNVMVFGLVGVFLVLLIATLGRVDGTVARLDELARGNHRTLNTIRDCTQPTGTCYQRGARRTAQAVASLNAGTQQAAAAATSCAIHLSREGRAVTYRSVYRCIVSTTHGPHR